KRTGNPPKITKPLENVTVDIGKPVEFKCEVESKERATIAWYKNRIKIDEPRHYKQTYEGKTASLSIQRATLDFSGVYTCEVTNQFGKDEVSATLFVKEPGMKMPEIKDVEMRKATPLEPMAVFEMEEPQKKTAEVKKVVKKKKKVPGKAAEEEEGTPEKDKPSVPEIQADEEPAKKGGRAPVTVVKEPTPEPSARKNSLEPPGTGSRRGSASNLMPLAPPARRGSITLVADEKGLLTDDKGNVKKLRPGEVLEVRQPRRKASADMRRASVSEMEERIDKPSTPLKAIPEDEESPPSIVDYQENVTAVEGATAYLCVQVEGNPPPEFRFYKEGSEIFEGGRYKVVTDGETNSLYFCIRKAKTVDEGRYKIVAYNKLGEDSIEISLFVSDESGMDFRAMLKRRQYAKWGRGEGDPDWGNLKPGEQERRPSVGDLKKADFFVKKLEDQHIKEGRDKKVRFEAVFSRSNVKAKWIKNKQEIYMGKRYHISAQGDLHVLEINNPTMDDEARYTIQCNEATSVAYLEVDAPDPVYKIIKKLPPRVEQYTVKEAVLECTCNSSKAPVKWYKGNQQIQASDRYVLDSDTFGHKTLKIQNCRLDDTGDYTCKINEEEKTTTKLIITDQKFQFMRPLKSMRVMEKEKVVLECEVDEYDATVKWFKGDQELVKSKDKKFDITQEGRKRRLIFKSAKLTDEGEYTCKTNDDTTTCELIVEPGNKFVKRLKDTSAVEREQVVLEVELQDKKAPAEWFKDGQPIKPSKDITIKSLGDGRHQLIISNCKLEDAGEYECRSKELSTSCRLAVGEGEKPPKISRDKTEFSGNVNKPLTAEIPFAIPGTKVSDITSKLLRNGKPIMAKDIEVVVKNDKVVITFRKPPREASGDYELCLGNATGEDKMKLNFNFIDVPQPPQGPLDVTDIFRDRCKLSWKPPLDTGGLPLTHYMVEMQDTGARGGWIEIGTTENTNFDVTGLVNKKEYKFRVRAVNARGASDPLATAKPIIAKDPYDEPSKPGNAEVTDWDLDMVELQWTKPEKDGGSPITGYVIEYKDKFSKEWSKGAELGPTATKGKVEGLKEGVQYEFRIRAVNKAGPGEPSDPTKPIIVKARFVKPFIIGDDLRNIVVKKGQTIKYDINIGGEPPPDIKWDTNGVEIVGSKKISIDKSARNTTITIKDAERADGGKITLTLTNTVGSTSATADVVVLDKPSRPAGPLQIEEVKAEKAVIKWDAPKDTGGSEIEGYLIEKQDTETGRWVPAGEVGPHDRKFTVEPLTPKKKYNFRVKAKNKEGESEALTSDKPVLAKNPYDEPGKPGRPEIADYDNTMVDLKWSAPSSDGGAPITNYVIEMKEKLSNDWKEVLKTDGSKTEGKVTGLKENDSVQFRVKAINKAGPSEPSTETPLHIVKHRNLKPYIDRTNLNNVVLKVGRSHKFEVDIRGEPPPKVTWTFGEDAKLSNNDFIKIDNRDYHSDLYLNKLTRKHSGKYIITATNASGKDSVPVDVTVLGAPSRPEGPLKVSDVHKEGCKLKWNKPKDDGGLPIKQYEIEKLDKDTGRWTRCGKTDEPEFDVTGLTPGKEYLFRVVATNDEGESEPLETLEPILAKNPFDEPGKTGTPQIVDYDNIKVDLKWDKPKSDGGAPITKYIIEKKLKGSPDWEKALEVPGDKLQTDVADLKER
ncbi:Twitchin, partial [Araneus ventricosus]